MKLGLIREYKSPPDRRVAFTPEQCLHLQNEFPGLQIAIESSPDRIYRDDQYKSFGLEVSNDVSDCDVLFGIKEIPVDHLIPGKTYFIFSHTIKKQPHNREMLKAIVRDQISLVDYECLHKPDGTRMLGFGRYAGLAGVYETFKALGLKYRTYSLLPPGNLSGLPQLISELRLVIDRIQARKHKIVLTGNGRVSGGCEEMLTSLGIRKVAPAEFLSLNFPETVYTLLDTHDLYRRKDGGEWNHEHFFTHHALYESQFAPYSRVADVMINGVFWDKDMPPHFTKEDTRLPEFSLQVIADISCDIEGSVPITLRDTRAEAPVFGWDPVTQAECPPYLEHSIDVMAVSNLPSEIPADASEGFGGDLIKFVIPELLKTQSEVIGQATICRNGSLTPGFKYLEDYITGE